MLQKSIDMVLFDLGGVLVEVNGVAKMRELAGIESDEAVWARWLTSPWVRSFERGRCTVAEFSVGIVSEWQLPLSAEEFTENFVRWPATTFEGAEALVAAVAEVLPVGCLSNTNEPQWEAHFAGSPVIARFGHRFLSHELGMLKPDAELFEHVIEVLGRPPERVLFLDDNALNVDAAIATGMKAVRVRGVEGARSALVGLGVLA